MAMRSLILLASCLLSFSFALAADPSDGPPATPKVHKIAVGGEGGWDYLTVDSEAKRLYVSRGNRVVVIDLAKEAVVGELPDTPGVHGMALVPELGKGFTSNGGDATVTVFDTKTLKAIGKIEARGIPDAILYDAASKRVFTFNHRTDDATVIDAAGDKVVGTINFEAEPEAAVADGKGHVYVNLRSSSEVAEIDAASLQILHRWPLAPGVRPNGLGFDAKHRRLFSTCGNQMMVVMDADSGSVLGTAEIGRGSDGCVFDPGKGLAYSSNGDGTLSVVGETEPGKFATVSTIPTQPSARTMALDPKTHRVYLSAATMAPAAEGQPQTGRGRRNFVPGSFSIIVVGD
jgi:DNA-binding beta-propeller fold protein YncE